MKELTIPLKTNDKVPLYEQIYEYIKQDITDGKISPKEKLPSTRLLAKFLQVSRSTVDLAYGQLLSEGYVRTVPGSGYFVCEIQNEFPRLEQGKGNRRKPHESKNGCALWNLTPKKEFPYDFSLDHVEWSDFSMNSWRKAIKCMMQEEMGGLFESGAPQGEENLRDVICSYLHRARGVDCTAEQIVIGAGNEYLLMLLGQMLEKKGRVAMESPTYRQAYQTFGNLDWEVLPIPMDDGGMVLKELEQSKAGLAYIMPSHQFPLGNVMPMKRRMELLQWAGRVSGRYIIEDDYDSEFRYKGKPIPSLQGSDPYGCVIYLGTFSKSIAPAIRVSYMVLPPRLLETYRKRCGFYSSTVSRVQQQILFHFMKEGYFERHLNKMRRIYRSRHDVLLTMLKGRPWVKAVYGENAGLHVLVEVKTEKSEETVIEKAMAQGVRVYGLREYSIHQNLERQSESLVLLLGYGGLTEEQIKKGVEILGEAVRGKEAGSENKERLRG